MRAGREVMKFYFVETEPSEARFFEEALRGQELRFAADLGGVKEDAEILSIFIQSQIDAAFLDRHPSIKLIITRSTTCDHVDLGACAKRSVTVCNVASYGDYTVAEHTFALILAVARRLREAMNVQKLHSFSYEAHRGFELRGKTLGVVGAGRIGLNTIKLARGFSMAIVACDIAPQPDLAISLGFEYVTFEELLRRSHIISLHATLTSQTLHMINRETLAKCMHGVVLINTARGALIDTHALLEAIESGLVAGAGLDVLEEERVLRHKARDVIGEQIIERMHSGFRTEESRVQNPTRVDELQTLMHNETLLSRPEVVFTPHVAFNSVEAIARINEATLQNFHAFLAGKPINVLSPG